MTGPHHVLASTSTLLYPGGTEYAHHVLMSPPSFKSRRRNWTSNELVPQIKLYCISCHYSLISYLGPDHEVEWYNYKYHNTKLNRILKINNLIQKASVWSSQKLKGGRGIRYPLMKWLISPWFLPKWMIFLQLSF